jgi:hypothetical protein
MGSPVTTLGQAQLAGALISLKCQRSREGLKSVRACALPIVLHVPSLVAALGHDAALEDLQHCLRCPKCGSDHYEIRLSMTGSTPAEEPSKPRRMQPVRAGSGNTLADCLDEFIVVKCDCRGGRRGQYRKETLLAVFPGETPMHDLLEKIAAWRGCAVARPNPTRFDLARTRECGIGYDVE